MELEQSTKDGHFIRASMPDFLDWCAQTRTIQSAAVFGGTGEVTLTGDFTTRRALMANVGAGFFDVMSTHALIGRTFGAAEQKSGGPPTIVLSYELAALVFGMPANALQKTAHLNGMAFTVIGVMPPKFDYPDRAQL